MVVHQLTTRLKFGMSVGLPTFYRGWAVALRNLYRLFDDASTVLAVVKQTARNLAQARQISCRPVTKSKT